MLILIAGITGSLGSRLAVSAISRGLSVRGLGRNEDKLKPEISQKLESFITSNNYYDIPALEKAVAGVDAIICAYSPSAILDLDANLLLLRAAERASVKIFIASSWNNDWTKIKFGDFEPYDPHIAFEQQAAMTSPINPVYFFTGHFADFIYTRFGPGAFDASGSIPKMKYWGDGNQQRFSWIDQNDAADWTIEILLNGKGVQEGKGGYFRMRSGEADLEELALAYKKVKGVEVEIVCAGTLEDLENDLAKLRKEKGRLRYFEYLPEAAEVLRIKKVWEMTDVVDLSYVRKPTLLEDFLQNQLNI